MSGAYLGPRYSNAEITEALDGFGASYGELDEDDLLTKIAELLNDKNVIGWFQGRMEFGPRALGGRSIIGDARSNRMQSLINLKIKSRESFRPFAPSVLAERASDYFELHTSSPYMLIVAPIREALRAGNAEDQVRVTGLDKLSLKRSELPAITHVDFSARIQTVDEATNPRFYKLLKAFENLTGCAVLINTSFNVRGEPIVCTPADAYRCFMRTELDFLVLENFLLAKSEQPAWQESASWCERIELD